MIKGLGQDVVEIDRIRSALKKHESSFYSKLFTREEIAYCLKHKDAAPSFAGRFAAKEAIAKALKVGFGESLGWLDIEILNDPKGCPYVIFSKQAIETFNSPQVLISISHEKTVAVAVAIWSADP